MTNNLSLRAWRLGAIYSEAPAVQEPRTGNDWHHLRKLSTTLIHKSPDPHQLIRRRVIGQQLAPCFRYGEHVFVLHTEAAWNVNQRLERSNHPFLDSLIAVTTYVRLLVQVQADAMSDEADRLKT